jgi:hypothetical protein
MVNPIVASSTSVSRVKAEPSVMTNPRAASSTSGPKVKSASSSSSSSHRQEVEVPSVEQNPMSGKRGHANRRAHSTEDDDGEDGATLLANIDQLYNDIMQGQTLETEGSRDTCLEHEGPIGEGIQADTVLDTSSQQQQIAEVSSILEEVLWSALLLKRGAIDGFDVQKSFLEMMPPNVLRSCCIVCGPDCVSSSLLHRLSTELPNVHAALIRKARDRGEIESNTSASLVKIARETRDRLLVLASTTTIPHSSQGAVPSSEATTPHSFQGAAPSTEAPEVGRTTRKTKPRKTSLSHWTSECLGSLEAPPRRLAQNFPK